MYLTKRVKTRGVKTDKTYNIKTKEITKNKTKIKKLQVNISYE